MKGNMLDWGSEQQISFEKTKILVKQMKALGITQAGLPFELAVSVTLDGMGWALAETTRGRVPLGFWS